MNRLFRSSVFPLALQLLTLAAFVLLIAGWRAGPLYLIPGLYGGAFAVMLIAWRLS